MTDDVAAAIKAVKAGRVEFKMDKSANVSIIVGKRSFSKENLAENAKVALSTLVKSKPEVVKGKYIKNVTLSSTMSPGVRILSSELVALSE